MTILIVKYAVTALIVAGASELAKRSGRAGALVSSLPLVTIMVMIWLHVEGQDRTKIADHAWFTFWYVLPTLPMFLLMPVLLHRSCSFWVSLGACVLITVVCFALTASSLRRFGIHLWP